MPSGILITRLSVRRRDSLSPMQDTVAPALTSRSELKKKQKKIRLVKLTLFIFGSKFYAQGIERERV